MVYGLSRILLRRGTGGENRRREIWEALWAAMMPETVQRLAVLLVASSILMSCEKGPEKWSCGYSAEIRSIEIDHQNKTALVDFNHRAFKGLVGVDILQVNDQIAFEFNDLPFTFDMHNGRFGDNSVFFVSGCNKVKMR